LVIGAFSVRLSFSARFGVARSDHCDVTAQGTNQNPENDPYIAEEIVMNEGGQERRTVWPHVLGAGEGEHLIHFRDHGQIVIKADSARGFDNLALGTQQVTVGAGVPIHRHLKMNEAFYVLEGSGAFLLNDVRHSFEKGGTIFIPKNSWHGFVNPDQELLLLWIVSPAGLDGFFRETCSPPGQPPKQLSREQIKEVALKYAMEFQ
jgi:quercetin dioxygenase-like cupin family protein